MTERNYFKNILISLDHNRQIIMGLTLLILLKKPNKSHLKNSRVINKKTMVFLVRLIYINRAKANLALERKRNKVFAIIIAICQINSKLIVNNIGHRMLVRFKLGVIMRQNLNLKNLWMIQLLKELLVFVI